MPICQSDYPLDWYQEEFIPYAEEYQALPDRSYATVINWMKKYMEPAIEHFGDSLLLVAHYYMGGEIAKLTEFFGGKVGDSYQLAVLAATHPEKKIIVESAVHFMGESIALLANSDQRVYLTNPKAGCTMEMHAKGYMVEPAFEQLNERYGNDHILPICYMNTSGHLKALTGAQGGAVCTSSNVKKIFEWALAQNKKIFFMPDQFMGENVAVWLGIPLEKIAYWPGGLQGAQFSLANQDTATRKRFDEAQLILFSSHCSVHSYFKPEMAGYWQQQGYSVVVHPECRNNVVRVADAFGSTAFIWDYVTQDKARTKKYAVGTENHMVRYLKDYCADRGIHVVNLGDAKVAGVQGMGCGCATMARNDPPHLVGLLDLLRQGKMLDHNRIEAGDVVNELTGQRRRLDALGQQWIIEHARAALQRMIAITEEK
jgi:quinolinate synthase